MSKRKQSKSGKGPFRPGWFGGRQPALDLETLEQQIERLLEREDPEQVLDLVAPLLEQYPQVAELHGYAGQALMMVGALWDALDEFEQARRLSRDPAYELPISFLYVAFGMHMHALSALRKGLRGLDPAETEDLRTMHDALEREVQGITQELGLSRQRVEQGLLSFEEANRQLQFADHAACIAASHRAIRQLGNWPPPHNNLALALFFDGQPDKALEVCQQVLAHAPQNVHALSNRVRFLVLMGRSEEARATWTTLQAIEPQSNTDRVKIAEAAAALDEDAAVLQLLKPLDRKDAELDPTLLHLVPRYLAVAEANTGQLRAAQRRLNRLGYEPEELEPMRAALKAKQPGPGWASRYPYFFSREILHRNAIEKLAAIWERSDRMPEAKLRSQLDQFAAQFPQIVLAATKMIWEEGLPEVGIGLLKTIGTPEAYAALRDFGFSQSGDYDARMDALMALLDAGEIQDGEIVRVWHRGEWQEVQLREQVISDEVEITYPPHVVDLLSEGYYALQDGDLDKAEQRFRQAMELQPDAKDAYSNLGVAYAIRGDRKRAEEMFHAALDLDPDYAVPRCNLANFRLDAGDVAGAREWLAPLMSRTKFHPQDIAYLMTTQGRIAMIEEDYESAQDLLETALEFKPDYTIAQDLLERLELLSGMQSVIADIRFRQQTSGENRRARMRAKVSTPDAPLPELIGSYTKDTLTAMARVIMPEGGWSQLHKADLRQTLLETLQEPDTLAHLVGGLQETERKALRQVLKAGGAMPKAKFDEKFDTDPDESPYWEYHEPQSPLGRLRLRGLLFEVSVKDEPLVVVPKALRPELAAQFKA